ncbi:hypothetical protein NKH91_13245 [Mesorhizobium sp. M0894]|uniref:hypothetical protein n=1 Tax=unclassified Mesorhizobium TaxID=325217 RepID=UPI00333AC0E3
MKVTILANYPPHAYKGLIQGSDREAAIKALFESVGGKVSGMMFTRGALILSSMLKFRTRPMGWT